VDFISMARPFLADAAIVAKGRRGHTHLINTCIACDQACIDRSLADAPVSCMVNPRAGRETEPSANGAPARAARRFAVVGGGPAGLEAARALAERGHAVELFEAAGELGGQFRLARCVPGKGDYGETIRYFTNELARLGVDVRLGRPLTAADAALLAGFDGVVLATGVLPRRIALPGAELPHVLDYVEAFAPGRVRGQRVAIIGGGGIGVDLAHSLSHGRSTLPEPGRFLVEQGLAPVPDGYAVAGGKQVTIMRRHGKIGDRLGRSTRWAVLQALRRQGVDLLTGVTYECITADGVRIVDADGPPRLIAADTVVIAAGQERNASLVPLLANLGVPFQIVGGAKEAVELDAVRAFEEGWRAAAALGA
jgi:2,4-dienoyl-CoA reductase (NADPH2)